MIRAMGRRERDSSPRNSLVKSWPARIPLSMRMVEPELPQSREPLGACKFGAVAMDRRLNLRRAPIARRGYAGSRACWRNPRRWRSFQAECAFGDPAKHGVTVRNGFIARQAHGAVQRFRRTNHNTFVVRHTLSNINVIRLFPARSLSFTVDKRGSGVQDY